MLTTATRLRGVRNVINATHLRDCIANGMGANTAPVRGMKGLDSNHAPALGTEGPDSNIATL